MVVERGVIQSRYTATPSCLQLFEEQENLAPLLGGLFGSMVVFFLAIVLFLYWQRITLVKLYASLREHFMSPVVPPVTTPACAEVDPEALYAECEIYPAALNPFIPEFHGFSTPISVSGIIAVPSICQTSTLEGELSLPDLITSHVYGINSHDASCSDYLEVRQPIVPQDSGDEDTGPEVTVDEVQSVNLMDLRTL